MTDEQAVRGIYNSETGKIEYEPVNVSDPDLALIGLNRWTPIKVGENVYHARILHSGKPVIVHLPKEIHSSLVREFEYDDIIWISFNGEQWVIMRVEKCLLSTDYHLPHSLPESTNPLVQSWTGKK